MEFLHQMPRCGRSSCVCNVDTVGMIVEEPTGRQLDRLTGRQKYRATRHESEGLVAWASSTVGTCRLPLAED